MLFIRVLFIFHIISNVPAHVVYIILVLFYPERIRKIERQKDRKTDRKIDKLILFI